MSIILGFSIDAEAFTLGRVLGGSPEMRLELERSVPTGEMAVPFVWATGDDHDAFERRVRDHPAVEELVVLDRLGQSGLYRIAWEEEPPDLTAAIAAADAAVLDAHGDRRWVFRLRFPDHAMLSQFHDAVVEHGITLNVDRVYTLTEPTDNGHRFGLTQEQRDALVLALRRGYFETPSETALDVLADTLDISRQAVSQRIRRGTKAVLREVLLSSVADRD